MCVGNDKSCALVRLCVYLWYWKTLEHENDTDIPCQYRDPISMSLFGMNPPSNCNRKMKKTIDFELECSVVVFNRSQKDTAATYYFKCILQCYEMMGDR